MSKGKSQFFEKGRRHGSVFALVCPQKEVRECVVARFATYVLSLGLNRVRLRSNGEPPIGGLLGAVATELWKSDVEVLFDQPPKGDSKAGGLHEATVHAVQGKGAYPLAWHGSNPGGLPCCVDLVHTARSQTHQQDSQILYWTEGIKRVNRCCKHLAGLKFNPRVESKWSEGIMLDLVDATS